MLNLTFLFYPIRIKNQQVLANKLCKISGMNSAFFCNSGSEANETALKLARLHANNKKLKKKITKKLELKNPVIPDITDNKNK